MGAPRPTACDWRAYRGNWDNETGEGSFMPNFGNLIDKAKQFAQKHRRLVSKGISQAERIAEKKTGGKHDAQIRSAGTAAQGFLGSKGAARRR